MLGAPMTLMGRDADAYEAYGRLLIQAETHLLDLPPPSLPGAHQFDNAGLAVTAPCWRLGDPQRSTRRPSPGVVSRHRAGLACFQQADPSSRSPRIAAQARDLMAWLDGGHQPRWPAGALAETAGRLVTMDPRPLVLIVGMFARKDAQGFFEAPFQGSGRAVCSTTFSTSPTAADPEELAKAARDAPA